MEAPEPHQTIERQIQSLRSQIERLEEERAEIRQWLKRLEYRQQAIDRHVRAIEDSLIFRFLRWLGRPLLDGKARLGQALLHSSFHDLYRKLHPDGYKDYEQWVRREMECRPSLEWYRARAAEFSYAPMLSIVLPVHDPPRAWLEEAIQSVIRQTYSGWELCICDDASAPWVSEYLRGLADGEPRLRFFHSEQHLGIAGALNEARSMARGDYLVFLDQDDVLSPYALHYAAEALQKSRAELLYSDEDYIDEQGHRVQPLFKPDWSPDLLLSCMYLGHLLVVSRHAADLAGGFRSAFDGAQDYDLALRLTDRPAAVCHIPQVLYHWRKHAGSTAADARAKPYTHAAGRLALEDTIRRRGCNAVVEDGPAPNWYRLHWQPHGRPLATIIICSRSPRLVEQCLSAIRKCTNYEHRQILVVQHVDGSEESMENVLLRYGAGHLRYEGAFHFSRMNNLGADAAEGEILVFLNDDIEPLEPSWLERLAAQAQRPDIGIAGAKLLYPAGTIQHAGIAIGIGDGCGHPGRNAYAAPYWSWLPLTRDVSAVTGACLAIRKDLFQRVGGFGDAFPNNYNDTDLCLRVRQAGYRVLFESGAVLRHYECQTRKGGVAAAERERWYAQWPAELEAGDPFYSRHLSPDSENVLLNLAE